MTDMTSLEQTEQPVNTEVDRTTPVVVLYRGSSEEGKPTNPFMKAIADGLKQRGLNVIDRPISSEEVESEIEPFNRNQEDLSLQEKAVAAIGTIDKGSVVVIDKTLDGNRVSRLINEPRINAYKALEPNLATVEGIKNEIGPIVEAIRKDGKEPVVWQPHLGDHRGLRFSEEDLNEIEGEGDELYDLMRDIRSGRIRVKNREEIEYAVAIKKSLGVPIIGASIKGSGPNTKISAYHERREVIYQTIKEYVEAEGIDPSKAVLLVDHHLADPYTVEAFSGVEITPICSCCLGLKEEYTDRFKSAGYNLFPITEHLTMQPDKMKLVLDKLVSQIQESQAAKGVVQPNT